MTDHNENGRWCNYCDDMTDHLSSGHPEGTKRIDTSGRAVATEATRQIEMLAAEIVRLRELVSKLGGDSWMARCTCGHYHEVDQPCSDYCGCKP